MVSLKNTRRLDTFPGSGNLDADSFFGNFLRFIQLQQPQCGCNRGICVKRQRNINLCADAAGETVDLRAKLNGQKVNSGAQTLG